MGVSERDFDFIRTLVCEHAGIVLETGKQYLVEARLQPLARKRNLDSIETVVQQVRQGGDLALRQQVIEAMTTNETTFFRDFEPFEAIKKHVIPRLMEARRTERALHFWYGASSTGQEPYSVVMLIEEHFPELAGWNVTHTATDINLDVLERARQGRFTQSEINRGLPASYLVKYFEKQGLEWQLKAPVREKVRFEPLNLVKAWPRLGPFDVVMLRNVMIYFDVEAKRDILARIRRVMRPDGFFFLGGAETTMGLDDNFARLPLPRSGCYGLVTEAALRKGAA
ncbi:MAG: protein-glutamate O-methyltransferase CheR [Vicinamibacterales bacterium]